MVTEIIKIISILLLTMVKFIFGPTLGYAGGYSYFITVILTVTGMMMSVFLFTFLGTYIREHWLKKFLSKKKMFTKRNRTFVKIWRKYGIKGVAFLTPLLLTPIGGTLLLSAYHTPKRLVMTYMFVSAVFWAFILTAIMYFAGDLIKPFIPEDPHLEEFQYLE